MASKGEPIKLGYLNFDPGGMSKIGCRPKVGPISEYRRSPIREPSSYPSHNSTVSSAIPIPEDRFKELTHTPRLGDSHPTRGPKRLDQPEISYVNLDESSLMSSVKSMDPGG